MAEVLTSRASSCLVLISQLLLVSPISQVVDVVVVVVVVVVFLGVFLVIFLVLVLFLLFLLFVVVLVLVLVLVVLVVFVVFVLVVVVVVVVDGVYDIVPKKALIREALRTPAAGAPLTCCVQQLAIYMQFYLLQQLFDW
ncbi:unnamed protein product [Polarella glacialis]|uniref:Uncharacterized protein n=1 Tax=Polarella glacialis TaxID=89957 RepID=A0A813I1M0_POLGL|nr:unnamed protein product [Polarella glacialis]